MSTPKHTNALISETSPYLLQHAHNPVQWYAWNDETWKLAKEQNKLVLISIGYSACHWCHVMEHESFEDEQVAAIMNDLFINIKVDREERPDVDQVYMSAVQIMTGHGGWPLNCFAMPDGRPVYGGTYFPNEKWKSVLMNLADLWKNERTKVEEYAERLTDGIRQSELVSVNKNSIDFTKEIITDTIENWKKQFDNTEGGPNRAPKFPLPNNYQFLLRYAHQFKDKEVKKHVDLTLKKIAFGGIYDQVGGGFARYSTDMLWKVPHFEKMLYDNAQLISLYSEAYSESPNDIYKDVVFETIEFIERELTSPEGAFYSALDADSEGVEGKFYVWTKKELEEILGGRFQFASEYFNINDLGFWEHNNYILLRNKTDKEIADKFNLSVEQLQVEIKLIKKNLLFYRSKRVRPGLDDKTLTSWNALMIKGLTDAYSTFDEQRFLDLALKNAEFILQKQIRADGGINHSYKNGRTTINGFLEDYCFTIEAFISLYESCFDEKWLKHAEKLTEYCIQHFFDEQTGMFFFTSSAAKELIARKMETHDNVIPASNSSMAKCLFYLGRHLTNEKYLSMSRQMLNNVVNHIPRYGAGYSNWGILLLNQIFPFYELAIVGKAVNEKVKELKKTFIPNRIFACSTSNSGLPLLENRLIKDKTLIYVCSNNTCQLPVESIEEALKNMNVAFEKTK